MFNRENNEGHIEYKRHLCSKEIKKDSVRFNQLVTQMKFRLNEGNGVAEYYIGINDDGSIYKLSDMERDVSLKNFKKLVTFSKAVIKSINYFDDYIHITIKDKNKDILKEEKRILLLGDTETGKTTFLAYLIKNKMDINDFKSRLYILNHKHELENGKTTSFNYQDISYKNYNFVFIDTPGDDLNFKNIKKRHKIILSFNFDLVIFFKKNNNLWEKQNLYTYYVKELKIPYIEIDLFNKNTFINMLYPPSRYLILEFLYKYLKKEYDHKESNTVILQLISSYPNDELGLVYSGFLSSGKLYKNQKLFLYDKSKSDISINSIYFQGSNFNSISSGNTITLSLDNTNEKINGFISNKNFNPISNVKLKWIYINDLNILKKKEVVITINNKSLRLKKKKDYYILLYPEYYFNIINCYFFHETNVTFGFGKLISP